jgi:hypothetical protein
MDSSIQSFTPTNSPFIAMTSPTYSGTLEKNATIIGFGGISTVEIKANAITMKVGSTELELTATGISMKVGTTKVTINPTGMQVGQG